MTDEIETERAALIAKIDAGEPLTDADHWRVAEIAAADMDRPLTPAEMALRIVLDEAVALVDHDPPAGLSIADLEADPLIVRDGSGAIFTTIPRSTLTDLIIRIEATRT